VVENFFALQKSPSEKIDLIIFYKNRLAQLVDQDDILRHPLKVIHHLSTRFSTTPSGAEKVGQIETSLF